MARTSASASQVSGDRQRLVEQLLGLVRSTLPEADTAEARKGEGLAGEAACPPRGLDYLAERLLGLVEPSLA